MNKTMRGFETRYLKQAERRGSTGIFTGTFSGISGNHQSSTSPPSQWCCFCCLVFLGTLVFNTRKQDPKIDGVLFCWRKDGRWDQEVVVVVFFESPDCRGSVVQVTHSKLSGQALGACAAEAEHTKTQSQDPGPCRPLFPSLGVHHPAILHRKEEKNPHQEPATVLYFRHTKKKRRGQWSAEDGVVLTWRKLLPKFGFSALRQSVCTPPGTNPAEGGPHSRT